MARSARPDIARAPISVAIATRNRPDRLLRCLSAVLEGELLPQEVLIVDQSRDTATETLVAKVAAQAPTTVRYIRQAGDGLSRSRNLGFASATTDYVAVTDDDCVPDRSWVSALSTALATAPAPGAISGRVLPIRAPTEGFFASSTRDGVERRDFVTRVAPWEIGTGGNFLVSRQLLREIGGYDVRLGAGTAGGAGEDIELIDRLIKHGARIRFQPDAIIYHDLKDAKERQATRLSYGRGIGALCALRVRGDDRYGWTILRAWTRLRLSLMVRAFRSRNRRGVLEEMLVFRGTLAGLLYGLGAPSAAPEPDYRP